MPESISDRISDLYATESRRVLATLIRLLGDIDQAEEALQEAFGAALTTWPRDGIPKNPRAWLVSTGKFKGIDALRRKGRRAELIHQKTLEDDRPYTVPEEWDGGVIEDDQLRLIFTCCHPALPMDARIALALRVVCGLSSEEIAQAFLIPVETMKKRISRAKASIRRHQISYEIPPHAELADRLDAVLHVVYLVYNEGYSASSGPQHLRRPLTTEALFLCRLIAGLLPEPEATGLLALLLLHESRSGARTDAQGDLIPLEEQDRSLWDRELIAEGTELVWKMVMSGRLGSYGVQAAIATVHAAADSVETTQWNLIIQYYDLLVELKNSPVVVLNRAIAIGMRDGPRAGLAIIEDLLGSAAMDNYHRAHAARADLAYRAGALKEARNSYRRALELVRQEPERRYLAGRLARIQES